MSVYESDRESMFDVYVLVPCVCVYVSEYYVYSKCVCECVCASVVKTLQPLPLSSLPIPRIEGGISLPPPQRREVRGQGWAGLSLAQLG